MHVSVYKHISNSSYHMVFVLSLSLSLSQAHNTTWSQNSVHLPIPWCLCISFSQTNQLGVYTLTTSPSPPSTKEQNTSQATFPLPHPPLLFFSRQPTQSFLPPFSLSLSPFQWMHNPPFSQACPGGWGSGHTHTHTHPHHICRRTNAHHREW